MSGWSTHHAEIYPEVIMSDRGSLALIAEVEFRYHPGAPEQNPTYACGGTPADPPEFDAVTVKKLFVDYGGGKHAQIPLIPELCKWISENADEDELMEAVSDDKAYERAAAAAAIAKASGV